MSRHRRLNIKIVPFYVVMALAMVFALGTFVAGSTIVYAVGRSMLPQSKSDVSPRSSAQPGAQQEESQSELVAQAIPNQMGSDATNLAQGQTQENLRQEKHEEMPDVKSFSGLLTDSRCGARHSRALGKSAAECARFCVRHGAQYIIVNGANTYKLEGRPAQLRNFAGQRVVVMGSLQDGAIRVRSLSTAD